MIFNIMPECCLLNVNIGTISPCWLVSYLCNKTSDKYTPLYFVLATSVPILHAIFAYHTIHHDVSSAYLVAIMAAYYFHCRSTTKTRASSMYEENKGENVYVFTL